MNKTIALVNEWGNFEANHPDADIKDFCRYYLAKPSGQKINGPLVGGVVPNFVDGLLMKIIGRISKLNMLYANIALKGTGLNQIEEFGMLMTIKQEKNPKKTEVIYANLFELSSGTDMLNRMKKRGLIKEYDDKEDKRSKRIELTSKGEKVVKVCSEKISKNAKMMAHNLTDDDKELCVQFLKSTEIEFSSLWRQHRRKAFDDIYNSTIKESSNDFKQRNF